MNHALRACLIVLFALPAMLQARQNAAPTDSLRLPEHFKIAGFIVDSLTKRPVQSAGIFVNNTSLDTVSLRNGYYRLSRVPMGKHEIVVTAVGYMPRTLIINGALPTTSADTIRLLPMQPVALNEMMARTSDKRWQFFYQQFKEHFIGTTEFAKEVKILNPWVLRFEESENKEWSAMADELLLLENMALGYRLKCYLKQLAVAKQIAVFDACLFFEPIKTLDQRLADRWRNNRLIAYRGSLMEFLRRMAEKNTDSLYRAFRLRGTERFYHTTEPDPQSASTFNDLKQPVSYPHEFALNFSRDQLQINYYGAGEDMAYRRFVNRMTKIQRLPARFRASWLASRSPQVIVNRMGYFNNAMEVEVYGYWEYLRIAERLPITYFP
jgi:hypothetical protein